MRISTGISFMGALLLVGAVACTSNQKAETTRTKGAPSSQPASEDKAPLSADGTQPAPATPEGMAVATFAGGCFWCMEPPFEKLDGVSAVYSGYTGGKERQPAYKQVARGRTGHTEAVHVVYDPSKVTYEKLLDTFWRSMDPTDLGGQFVDRGTQYRPEIFYHDESQKAAAEKSKAALQESGRFSKPIVVPLTPASVFWMAEEYHQDFYKKSSAHYKRYRSGSGRDRFLAKYWDK